MTRINKQVRRFVAVGAFAVAAVAAPIAASAIGSTPAQDVAAPCLAWFGNKEDGNCLSYSNGSGVDFGTPNVGIGSGGLYTGPLVPGRTINQGIN